MTKQELIEELRVSTPSSRMLMVVKNGAVQVGDELIMVKQGNETYFDLSQAVRYGEHHEYTRDMGYSYDEIFGKDVLFDQSVFGLRGLRAIAAYLETKAKVKKNGSPD